ncbi:MAG: HAMP domain-containing protein [Oscillospiraceae bacterium]|nr:HAMP domain-containing protein [Oscillospiraceae bacterium]
MNKKISMRIARFTTLTTIFGLVLFGIISCTILYTSTVNKIEEDMFKVAEIEAERVEWELKAFNNVAAVMGTDPYLLDDSISNDEKQEYINDNAVQYGLTRGNLVNKDGVGLDGSNYSDREYFQEAMKGNTCISEPLVSKITGKISIIISAPLWKDGVIGSEPIGAVYLVPDENFLNEIVAKTKFSENGSSYMIDKTGTFIAYENEEHVKNQVNINTMAQNDNIYAEYAAVHTSMVEGNNGCDTYTLAGVKYINAHAPVAGTDGWSVAVNSPIDDFVTDVKSNILFCIVLVIVMAATSFAVSFGVGKRIGDPVAKCAKRIDQLASGDFTSPVPETKSQDETKILTESTTQVVSDINNIIGDVGRVLEAMAEGDFSVDPRENERYYVGDYAPIVEYLSNIRNALNETLGQINNAADQVSAGSDQVSAGAQALSQGATEQASSIEELAATINVISDQIKENAEAAVNASSQTDTAGAEMAAANEKMTELVTAMNEISASSNETKNIIKTIEDIAFQTNILALNAAVEAARAGDAGKGFAVVADEVRNLAGKSAEAAHSTTALIEGTVAAIERGTLLVDEVADKMSAVADAAGTVAKLNNSIADASKDTADAITQITVGVEQISGVVQNNSATAEESAAASEELSGQANMLKDLISSFTFEN